MAALSAFALRAAAGAAREQAQMLRVGSSERRVELRRRFADAEILRAKCRSTCSAMSYTREARDRVTWSDLPWQGPEAELDDILVLLDCD
jgi:hypothetical protein